MMQLGFEAARDGSGFELHQTPFFDQLCSELVCGLRLGNLNEGSENLTPVVTCENPQALKCFYHYAK